MTAAAWVLLGMLTVTSLLLAIAIGGNADLAGQNRRLRREVRQLRADAAAQTVGGVR